jgi:hypothetical protein
MMVNSSQVHSSKLKIALVCDWFLPQMGGTEMHMRDLADRLSQEGHEVMWSLRFQGGWMVKDFVSIG